jgi:N-acyl-D-amino-acid deacylase
MGLCAPTGTGTRGTRRQWLSLFASLLPILLLSCDRGSAEADFTFEFIIRGGTIYDGTGAEPTQGDVAVKDGLIAIVAESIPGNARKEIDARGLAVAPGFINILSWAGEPLLVDGRALSDLYQGVTTEVMGEGISLGPLSAEVRAEYLARQGLLKYEIPWSTFGEALEFISDRGVAVNIASYVGAATIRMNVVGMDDAPADTLQIEAMRKLVRDAMEEGAMGVGSSLIYAPGTYADTAELVALAAQAAQCGGIYATHIRSETERFLEAIEEAIAIGKQSGAPVEIFHLKVGGRRNWHKLDQAIAMIESARESGSRITTDMYVYPASSTGLDASMPDWVQQGGLGEWIERLKNPEIRRRVISEMQSDDAGWENIMRAAGGASGVLLVGLQNPDLKHYIGRTLADVAAERGESPEETAIALVIEDRSRVGSVYFTMSEENLIRKMRLPYMSFASDGRAVAAEGIFLQTSEHPRSYGNFARVLGRFVRDEGVLSLEEAIHRMTGLPASVLSLHDRGLIQQGYAADLVVFDPETIQDHATYEDPHRYATGVKHVLVNGMAALAGGVPTGAKAGQFVRGRAWRGWQDGGCRSSVTDWQWR